MRIGPRQIMSIENFRDLSKYSVGSPTAQGRIVHPSVGPLMRIHVHLEAFAGTST